MSLKKLHFKFLLLLTLILPGIISYSQCNVFLGNDTVFCGNQFNLDPGSGWESYLWQNGSTSQTYSVNAAGTYYIEVSTTGTEQVLNGDFEQGNIGFTCNYLYTNNLWPEGTYYVGPNANFYHSNFVGLDHTPPPGVNFLIVNGAALPGTTVWGQTIPVTPNTDYKFSAWVCSVVASSPAQLQFSINGNTVGPVFTAPNATNTWAQYFEIWNSGASGMANISLVNQNTAGSGNDFGIDDISFKPIVLCTDTIIVSPPDLATTFTLTDAACFGEASGNIDQTVTGGYQPYSFDWSNNIATEDQVNIPAGIYSVTVTDAANCEITDNVTINEPQTAVAGSLVSEPVNCFGDNDGSIDLSPSGGTPPYSFNWSNGQNAEDIFNLSAITYTVTITDDNGCQTAESVDVNQPDLLSVILQGNSLSCHGDTDAFANPVVSGGVLDYSFSWNTGANTQGLTNLSAGTYSVTVTDNNGCSDSDSITFEEPDPVVLYSSSDQTICLSQSANIVTNASGGTLPYNYIWDPGGFGTPSITVAPYESTEYCVYIKDANACKSNERCISIYVNPPLDLEINIDEDSICRGDTVLLTSIVSGGDGGPYFTELFNGPIINHHEYMTPHNSGKIIVVAYDGCGTPNVADTVNVHVSDAPMVSFASNKIEGCEPLSVEFNLNYSQSNWTYYWDFDDGSYFNHAISAEPTHTFQNPGLFDINLTISNGEGCSRDLTIPNMIRVYQKPESVFESDPNTASIIDPGIDFYNYSLNQSNSFWIFGDGDSIWIETPPKHYYPEAGEYLVSLITESDKGCRDTSYQWIEITEENTFYIPNAFSPFSPVIRNRVFKPLGFGVIPESFRMFIYNRWGEQIFYTKNFDEGWDGKINNENFAPAGVYTWKITYTDKLDNIYNKTGTVTLLY